MIIYKELRTISWNHINSDMGLILNPSGVTLYHLFQKHDRINHKLGENRIEVNVDITFLMAWLILNNFGDGKMISCEFDLPIL